LRSDGFHADITIRREVGLLLMREMHSANWSCPLPDKGAHKIVSAQVEDLRVDIRNTGVVSVHVFVLGSPVAPLEAIHRTWTAMSVESIAAKQAIMREVFELPRSPSSL